MKKMMIGLSVGALVLSGALPVSAGKESLDSNERKSESIWEILDGEGFAPVGTTSVFPNGLLADLVLIAGMATMLDTCGNGKPFYTLFAPTEVGNISNGQVNAAVGGIALTLEDFLDDVLGASVADLQSQPAVVRGLLNDHLVNGSFSPWQLDQDEITTLTARSGFTLRNENGNYINDLEVLGSDQACNGWVYEIFGVIDSTPQVPTEGLNALDTPNDGTPGGSNSLPDTL